ncbi:MAG: FecR domain-containing protein [Tannerellaceae bacterium]|jgi:ferric-dicitrate binding protein FerR (iron transport regulator)|nr:FecR domain-containing protein [Tannerellaceae bacterium]
MEEKKSIIPDREIVWKRIQAAIWATSYAPHRYSRAVLYRMMGIAASVALILGASAALWLGHITAAPGDADMQMNTVITPPGHKTQIVLPDSTVVWLNAGSRLSYNCRYNGKARTVELEGEGYFDVRSNPELPFVVRAGAVDVKALGTAFNVKAYSDEDEVNVALVNGSVQLLAVAGRRVLATLHPNQSGVVRKDGSGGCRIVDCNTALEAIWRFNRLKFENEPVALMVKKLERWYGVHINVINVPPEQTYRMTIKTETLTELLGLINKLTPIEYEINGEEVMVRYK